MLEGGVILHPQLDQAMSCSQRAYRYLLDAIMERRLSPGDEINRKAVAEALGVSLAPISEAVSQLESEGLVEVAPRRQTRVRVIRREEVRGLLILREALECQAARLYAGAPVAANRAKLRELALVVDLSKPSTYENEVAECRFHEALVGLVESPLLSAEFARIMRRKLFHKINTIVPWSSQPPLDSHQALLAKLCEASPDEGEAIVREHLERGRRRILE